MIADLNQAREQNHPDLPVLEEVYEEFSKEHNVEDLLKSIESEEEQYWVERLAKLAAIDILTLGKVQPEHMNYMVALSDEAFASTVKSATTLAKSLNTSVKEIEAELGSDLVPDELAK